MKKNLLDTQAAELIIKRSVKLHAGSKPLWGKMNAAEMLLHCNLCNRQLLENNHEPITPTFKQKVLKVLSLYIVPHFPKNLEGASKNDTSGKEIQGGFEGQQQQFARIIRALSNHKEPIRLHHMAFGKLTTKEWGIAAWKHMDHHLRQFGV
jgi:hypothetical protein